MFETGSTAFMLICTTMVFLMTPGLAFFYGGLSRRKNVVNTMSMTFVALGIVAVVWVLVGWSFAYGGDGSLPFFGGFDRLGLQGMVFDLLDNAPASLSHGTYPVLVDVAFQAAFAMIATAIITGSIAGRMKFGAVALFMVLWVALVYAPLAHMVWGGEGSLIGDMIGALDFAGGDAVHISSGFTGLILCFMLGNRREFGMVGYRPHNVPFVALGAALLWFGWFGFNAGSALAADGVAALALVNTVAASGAALVSWLVVERISVGKPTLVGAATGLVAGLVGITPAAGFVEPWAAVVIGVLVSPICYFAIAVFKAKMGYDDALDAFGCHAVGGIVGGLSVGFFCVPELSWTGVGGLFYTGNLSLVVSQLLGLLVTVVFVSVVSLVLGCAVKKVFGGTLRVSSQQEAQGLDVSLHGESAYPAYVGLD